LTVISTVGPEPVSAARLGGDGETKTSSRIGANKRPVGRSLEFRFKHLTVARLLRGFEISDIAALCLL